MLKSRGMTLVESLFAFSIFITIIIIILSNYVGGLKHYHRNNQDYLEYLQQQNDKELNLWQTRDLYSSISEVLH